MRKIIDKIYYLAATVYRSYEKRGLNIPHFRMVISMMFAVFLMVVCLGMVFKLNFDYIMPWSSKEVKLIQWVKAGLYFGVLITIFSLIFRERIIKRIEVSEDSIRKFRKYAPVAFVLLMLVMAALLFKRGIDMGTIKV